MIRKISIPRIGNAKRIGFWQGPADSIQTDASGIRDQLRNLSSGCLVIKEQEQAALVSGETFSPAPAGDGDREVWAVSRAIDPAQFGDPGFQQEYGVRRSYMAGSMANGISGVELVTAMGKRGYLASYGAGGQHPDRIVEAIEAIKSALPSGPFAFNLIHNPIEPVLEQKAVDLYLQYGISTIEASAYLRLTPMVVQYRAAGLSRDENGEIRSRNRIIAKLSRPEVARQFLAPAPEKILSSLVDSGKISPAQAQLAAAIPMADDITVEADSGGHTDNRPLVGLLPSIIAMRNKIFSEDQANSVRIGAGGGLGTPEAALAAYAMGAAYIVTGSINQACLEAGTSDAVKASLALASAADMMMAPSADMFEMGGRVQVLKRGTMFPLRAQKLYEIYQRLDGLDQIDPAERAELEGKIFQKDFDSIWEECVRFFSERDPAVLEQAAGSPKRQMALIFRWYLGLATHWGIRGVPERTMDYQIWCGPSMGSFNDWTRNTSLERPENRSAPDLADKILSGAAYLYRINELSLQGLQFHPAWKDYLEPL